ncbi:hypothetical protein Ae201684_013470 [Aphanomyces euteiches]|uniref:DNA ligase n=1 Tax=Aphanomyces euteiches TaxID=100861 RepID=A0A6G0WNH2_9STRA|nr:hypothetical protein Ae201684_013470 [Aphanomyces euteiches]
MAEGLSFRSFCSLLETVVKTSKPEAKLKLIFSPSFRKTCGSSSLYPLLRLLCPHLDRERTYKLKEKKIAMLYVEILGLSPTAADGKKLLHWTDPTIVTSRAVGDFASVLQEVMEVRSKALSTTSHGNTYSLQDVNNILDTLASQEKDAQKKVFLQLITHCTAEEQKWLMRIIVKDMKIGLRHERVLQFMHPDAMEMFNHTNDLQKVCSELTNSMVRYVPQISPFQVFTPMLAKRVTFGDCTKAMNGNPFYMEPKLDGERITCHVKRKEDGSTREIQLFSRNGINYTEKYGPCISSYVNAQVRSDVDCILDGEMLVWDSIEFRYYPFGSLKTVASEQPQGINPHRWMCYVVWDVVYLGGPAASKLISDTCPGVSTSNIMGLPLSSRLGLLDRIFTSSPNRVMKIEQTLVPANLSDQERHELVMTNVDARLSAGYEGLILKDATSHYMCGEVSRKSQKWIKLKPDYEGMTQHLDVIVLGGYYGEGKRRGGAVSHFLLGVLQHSISPTSLPDNIPVISFCKVGTGYSLEELDALRTHLAPHWRPWEPNNDKRPVHFRDWSPKGDVRPDVLLEPQNSVCMEIYGFELTYSTQFQTGLTLRFPRLKAIRYDKDWHECLTLAQLNALKGQQLGQKRAIDVQFGEQKQKKLKTTQPRSTLDRGHVGVSLEYSQANIEHVAQESKLFLGLTCSVLPGKFMTQGQSFTKQTVEQLLFAHGATVVQNPHPKLHAPATTFIVAASSDGVKVQNYIKQGTYDILKVDWFLRCVELQSKEAWKATDYIFTTPETAAKLKSLYDCYGDHYTTPLNLSELQTILKSAHFTVNTTKSWQSQLKAMEDEVQEAIETPVNFFWRCVIYVDEFPTIDGSDTKEDPLNPMHHVAQCIRLYGGVVVDSIKPIVSHIVLPDDNVSERLELIRPAIQHLRRSGKEPVVTTAKWVQACLDDKQQNEVQTFWLSFLLCHSKQVIYSVSPPYQAYTKLNYASIRTHWMWTDDDSFQTPMLRQATLQLATLSLFAWSIVPQLSLPYGQFPWDVFICPPNQVLIA